MIWDVVKNAIHLQKLEKLILDGKEVDKLIVDKVNGVHQVEVWM